ncbi:1,4-dihydroxy-2-naphthoyl-CoA hydrolase [Catalinimonas alkaloidigena]|uniref:hotdog fold thioesterase n=1 Tax=Catalinimonas alkaloidigena TaxID=1075417 RepID=UPI00240678FB|nr:hotdog fold thioesterase [Catalinimonas alkaloidigena]MDF9797424.1 1,4-dihydroxy-2-naphthoyl-CoA hydrolase [Catalinimonas alkaloidigena]
MIDSSASLASINALGKGNMCEHLDIEITDVSDKSLSGKMPVDHRTKQPMGLLHGGASVVLAETLGSIASSLCINQEKQFCVGLEINANHIKAVKEGYVYGKAKAIHIGRKTHIWEVRIVDEQEKLICISRLTVAVLDKQV